MTVINDHPLMPEVGELLFWERSSAEGSIPVMVVGYTRSVIGTFTDRTSGEEYRDYVYTLLSAGGIERDYLSAILDMRDQVGMLFPGV